MEKRSLKVASNCLDKWVKRAGVRVPSSRNGSWQSTGSWSTGRKKKREREREKREREREGESKVNKWIARLAGEETTVQMDRIKI